MAKKLDMAIKIKKIRKSEGGHCVIDFMDDMDTDYIYDHTIDIYPSHVFFQEHRSGKEWDMIKIMVEYIKLWE